jgi:hypothetical protein
MEGTVGRSFHFEGEEYWAAEPEPITPEKLSKCFEELTANRTYKPDFYYGTKSQIALLFGIVEV